MPPVRHPLRLVVLLLIAASALWFVWLMAHAEHAEVVPVPLALSGKARASARQEPVTPLPSALPVNAERAELGRQLFHDPRLSVDNSISCASCHDLQQGGVDRQRFSIGVGGAQGDINAPTVYNAALNFRQFWDGRAATLEEQAGGPIVNPKEMAANWPLVLGRLGQDANLVAQFARLYPEGLTAGSVTQAIAEFERTLLTPSRFDRWLLGDDQALSRDELAGYKLFKQHGCVACHQGVNLGGNLYQRFGIMHDPFAGNPVPEKADLGRFNQTGRDVDRHVFKVPGLRNVALTAPYFHNASTARLEDAVRVMGRAQLGIELPESDVTLITHFLHSLNGEGLR